MSTYKEFTKNNISEVFNLLLAVANIFTQEKESRSDVNYLSAILSLYTQHARVIWPIFDKILVKITLLYVIMPVW